MAVTKLQVQQCEARLAPVTILGWLSAIGCMLYLWLVLLRLSAHERLVIPVIVLGFIGFGTAHIRFQMAVLWMWLLGVALFITGGFLFLRFILWWQRKSLSIWLARLSLLAALWFGLHVVGMNVPVFIDHRARANHSLLIAQGMADVVQSRLANQYEWGIATIPYSLLSYYLLVPIAFIFPETYELTAAMKWIVSLIHATTPFLLYRLAVRSGYSARVGFLAGALFVSLPVTHLYFHDGSYPTIIGVWWVVVTLTLVNEFVYRERWSWVEVGLIGSALSVALLIYVTHVVFVPLVIGIASLLAICYSSAHYRDGDLAHPHIQHAHSNGRILWPLSGSGTHRRA
ncbi:MAG: hypothetical protein C0184_12240 [Chloroflexus aggregans]|uniref:Glycosyltransferase RgtA/B/C/D-like domain-containing protein n=1 Tax=Chloroflexus aggregans TaxID=152260 RepID=A0A2J6X0A5_9CHLR|nr:MAG: hypothetical protein C0184_12240 [Chloroflexus aggregans]